VLGAIGLAHGLSRLDGNDDYRFLVRPGRGDWLRPHLGERLRLLESVRSEAPTRNVPWRTRVGSLLSRRSSSTLVPASNGAAEADGAQVVHFATQQGFRTEIPSLYQPWDLQHVHFPEFFPPDELRDRDTIYRTLSRQAAVVVTPTRWAAEDVIANLGVPRRKVAVIPPAASLTVFRAPAEAENSRKHKEVTPQRCPAARSPSRTARGYAGSRFARCGVAEHLPRLNIAGL